MRKIPYVIIREALAAKYIYFLGEPDSANPSATAVFTDHLFVSPCSAQPPAGHLCSIGQYSYTLSTLHYETRIGNYCSLAANITLFPPNHPYERFTTSTITYGWVPFGHQSSVRIVPRKEDANGVTIGNDVWIGAGAALKPGITIGDGAVVGLRSVVTKDVPPYHIVAGTPARTVKLRFPENTIEALLHSQWFTYDIGKMAIPGDIPINEFLELFHDAKDKGLIQPVPRPRPFLRELHSIGARVVGND